MCASFQTASASASRARISATTFPTARAIATASTWSASPADPNSNRRGVKASVTMDGHWQRRMLDGDDGRRLCSRSAAPAVEQCELCYNLVSRCRRGCKAVRVVFMQFHNVDNIFLYNTRILCLIPAAALGPSTHGQHAAREYETRARAPTASRPI